jgi:hypothetical protein
LSSAWSHCEQNFLAKTQNPLVTIGGFELGPAVPGIPGTWGVPGMGGMHAVGGMPGAPCENPCCDIYPLS